MVLRLEGRQADLGLLRPGAVPDPNPGTSSSSPCASGPAGAPTFHTAEASAHFPGTTSVPRARWLGRGGGVLAQRMWALLIPGSLSWVSLASANFSFHSLA